jgi:hypothetical protein
MAARLVSLVLALVTVPALGGPASLLGSSEDQLAGTLRGLLLQHLPDPLYDASPGWGRTKPVKALKTYRGRVSWKEVPKNDGLWRKFHAVALNPRDSVVLDVRELANTGPGAMAFTVFVAGDARFEATQQHWESGIKLYGTTVRARARVRAALRCEATVRPDFSAGLPDVVASLKVTKAEVGYENLVVEHVAGLGGDAAKILGAAGHDLINQWKPSLERRLLERANEAVVKAGRTKEVRVGLSKLMKTKK